MAGWSAPVANFTETAKLWLACSVMGVVEAHNFSRSHHCCGCWHGYGRGRVPQHISRSQHCSDGLARLWARSAPIAYFTETSILWLAGTVMGEIEVHNISRSQDYCGSLGRSWARSWRITYFKDPALLWLAGMAMRLVGADKILHGASVTVLVWHGYWRDRGP